MADAFEHLFSPVRLRHRTLAARITFGAHTANMAVDGLPGARHRGYYAERARGGAGMIVVEPVPVHRTGVLTRGNFRHQDDAIVEPFRELVEECRRADPAVVMIHQLYHVGQHGDAENSFAPNWSPSGLPSYHDGDGSHAMTGPEIEELVAGFVAAAARAQRSGFDGVEVFAAYHSVVDQFWTPWSNRRTDAWGGSFENRVRFSAAILRGIRERCGEDFIVGLAVSMDVSSGAGRSHGRVGRSDEEVTGADDGAPAGPALTMAELAEVVAWHDQRELIDYVSCGTGNYFDFAAIIPPSLFDQGLGVPFAAELKKVVTHALVQAEAHIRTPAAAEQVLAAGHADLVSVVRGQIADPHLVAKARQGRADDVRPCISCNQLCWGRRSRDYWISCLVNPSAGREFEWNGDRPVPAPSPRTVLVVGGGPAGLETARVAAERGHRVVLVEAGTELGGQLRLAGRQPSRGQILDLLAWYAHRLDRLGVDVRLGTELDAAGLAGLREAAGAEVVVLATGAAPARTGFQRQLPMVDAIPGLDRAPAGSVLAVEDVLDPAGPRPGPAVLLLDDLGDWRGLGTGVLLAESGHRVTLVTSAAMAGAALVHSAVDGLLRGRFARAGGTTVTSSVVTRWSADGAALRSLLTGLASVAPADTLVLAETGQPRTALAESLAAELAGEPAKLLADSASGDLAATVYQVGDCVAARRAWLAFFEGRALAQTL